MDSNSVIIFFRALAVAGFPAVLYFFKKLKLQNIYKTQAAKWQQKMAPDLSEFSNT
jgi:hypothetical protein